MVMLIESNIIGRLSDLFDITPQKISEFLEDWFGCRIPLEIIKYLVLAIIVCLLVSIPIYKRIKRIRKIRKWRRDLIEYKLRNEFHLYSEQGENIISEQRENNLSEKKEKQIKRIWSRIKRVYKKDIYIETRFQANPPHDTLDPEENIHSEPSESLIKFYLEKVLIEENKTPFLYCVLAGSGMGKSTFAINLLKQYINKYNEKTMPFDIYLYSLYDRDTLSNIKKIEKPYDSILILDALDENNEAVKNYDEFIARLEQLIKNFRIVIITCRTQFFDEENKEPNVSSLNYYNGKDRTFHHYHKHYISVFDKQDIKNYLRQKFFFGKKRKKATAIVEKCSSLMVRPLLLSYIDDLLQADEEELTTITSIYEILIDKWIDREVKFWKTKKSNLNPEELKSELHRFSGELAIEIFKNKGKNGGLFIPPTDMERFIDKYKNIDYNFKGRSLVNRDAKGNVKFAHKSFLEYFLAKVMIQEKIPVSFEGMDMTKLFFLELCEKEIEKQSIFSHYNLSSFERIFKEEVFSSLDSHKIPYSAVGFYHLENGKRCAIFFQSIKFKPWMKEYLFHINYLFISIRMIPSLYPFICNLTNVEILVIYDFFDVLSMFPYKDKFGGDKSYPFSRKNKYWWRLYVSEEKKILILRPNDFNKNRFIFKDDFLFSEEKIESIINYTFRLKNACENALKSDDSFLVESSWLIDSVLNILIQDIIIPDHGMFNFDKSKTPRAAMLDYNKLKDKLSWYDIKIDDDKLSNCTTLGEIKNVIREKLGVRDITFSTR